MSRHTLAVFAENAPGVLTRVSGLFARSDYNIMSITASDTEHPRISRITVVVEAERAPLEQIIKQFNKLINVFKVVELEPDDAVLRSLLLVKVAATDERRGYVLQIVEMFRAHVVDVAADAITIELTGSDQKINAFLMALKPYGIKELVQSGTVSIGRGARSLTERVSQELDQRR